LRRVRVYFNTSILIKAVNPWEVGHVESIRFIEDLLRRGFVLVYSDVHFVEGLRPSTESRIRRLFDRYEFIKCRVSVVDVVRRADAYVKSRGYSVSRRFDVAHMFAARDCSCRFIAAVDDFIRRRSKEFGLIYINYYTGIP